MAVLMESMGRRLFCAPYFSTACLAATLIAETAREDSQAGPLAAIVEGRMRFGVAIADGDWTLEAQGLHAALDAQDWRLSGEAAAVIDGASADTLLLFATLAEDRKSTRLHSRHQCASRMQTCDFKTTKTEETTSKE